MGDIYTERGLTETPTVNIGGMSTGSDVRRAGKIFDAIEEHAQQKAEKYQNLANKLYVNGSNLAIHDELERLSNDPAYASNPQAFAKEADKVASKIYGDIQNPELKADVIMNYELRKGSYINNAYTNYYKKQNAEQEYQVLKGLDNETKDYGLSVMNVINGDFSVDDLRKMAEAKQNFKNYLNSKNAQGFDIFTPHEKISMENAFEKNVLNSFKSAYLNADENEQEQFYHKIMNGQGVRLQTDEGEIEMNPSAVLSPSMLADIKNYVRDVRYKRLAEKEKEYKYGKKVALAEYMKNPTKSGLEQLKTAYPDLDDKTLDKLEGAYSESPNYMAETQAEALSMALAKIDEIATQEKLMPDGTPDYDYQFQKLVEANEFINKQSTGKDAQLSYEDVQMLREKAAETMINEEERKLRMEIDRDAKDFSKAIGFIPVTAPTGPEGLLYNYEPKNTPVVNAPLARMTAKNTIQLAERALSDKTVPPEQRLENAKNIYKTGKEQLIRIRNPEIGDKQVGDKYTLNGVTYEIVSFDNYDVQVRIVK